MNVLFTFTGTQVCDPFKIQVIASSEEEARQRALNAICNAARQELERLLKENSPYCSMKDGEERLAKIPVPTMPADPVDDHIGNFCANIDLFFEPIFSDPRDNKMIPFDEWIKYAPCKKEIFNPRTIKVYSCLNG